MRTSPWSLPVAPFRLRGLLGVQALLLFTSIGASALTCATDSDIWWHLAAGREILSKRTWLTQDAFSISADGRPWIDVHWLFQCGAYGLFQVGGLRALIYAKAAIAVGSAALLWGVVAKGSSRRVAGIFAVVLALSVYLARHLLLLRPVLLTLLFAALFLFVLERHKRRGGAHQLLWLPLLQMLWANVQGLFGLGPVVVLAYLIDAGWPWLLSRWQKGSTATRTRALPLPPESKRLVALLGACLVACLVTPYGLASIELAWQLLLRLTLSGANAYADNVIENIAPWKLDNEPNGLWHFKWYLWLSALVLISSMRRIGVGRGLLLTGLVALAWVANRNLLLLYWLATPLLLIVAAPRLAVAWRKSGRHLRSAWQVCVVLALVASTGLATASAWGEPSFDAPAPFRAPSQSADLLARSQSRGRVFAADHYGSYLIWASYPRFVAYTDTRWGLRTREQFEEYLNAVDHPEQFARLDARYHFDFVLLPTAYPERYLPLVVALLKEPTKWRLRYTDGSEVLFERADPSLSALGQSPGWDLSTMDTTRRVLGDLQHRYAGAPKVWQSARLHLAALHAMYGNCEAADVSLRDINSQPAEHLRAQCLFSQGNLEAASRIAERLLSDNAEDAQSLALLAQIAVRRGDAAQALALLRSVLSKDPFNREALALIEGLESLNAPTANP